MTLEAEQTASFKENAAGVWRFVAPHRGLAALLVVFGLISAAANGVVPYVTGRFFDSLVSLSTGQAVALLWGFEPWVVLLGIWVLVQIVANGADWIDDRARRKLDTKVQFEIQTEGFVHLLQLPLSYHANEHVSGVMEKFSAASWRIGTIVRTVAQMSPQLLSIVVGITLAATISPPLAGVLVLGVIVYLLLLWKVLAPSAEEAAAAHKKWNESWSDAAAAVNQVTSVKQAAAEMREIAGIRESLLGRAYELWYKLEIVWSNTSFYQRMVVFATQLTVFALSAHYVAVGTLTVGDLVALTGYSLMLFGPFVQLGHNWQTIQNGLIAAGQIERVFRLPLERYHPNPHFAAPPAEGRVAFAHVGFGYEPGHPPVLKDVSFEAAPGTVVALVGESGAGKSTIAQLISGYYFPTSGSVAVDGLDTREWDLFALRSRIAVVPQEVALFNESIEANIKYGSFDATREAVRRAAQEAHIDEFIATLPEGYETLVGERGVKLSVGQKQRVAIARAMLRDPRILILDEPTSALDAETERYITASLDELMKGRTTFIIAHRLSTVRRADVILVLKDGVIAEHGRHDELITIENGAYRRLYELHVGLRE